MLIQKSKQYAWTSSKMDAMIVEQGVKRGISATYRATHQRVNGTGADLPRRGKRDQGDHC